MIIAAARQERGLTVEDVSEATSIRATLIRHIEQDNFSTCGGSVYARGHIRSIARVLGIDPIPLIAVYDRDHGIEPAPVMAPQPEFDPLPHRGLPQRGVAQRGKPARSGFNWTPAMIGSLLAVCLVALVMLVLPDSGGGGDVAARSGAPATSASGGGSATAAPAPAPAPSTPVPTSMNVRVEALNAPSWLEVRDDQEQVLVQQLLQRGQERTVITERPLSIKMGDAGAVGLSCNGRGVGVPGGPGDVVTVKLTLAASGVCLTGAEASGGVAAAPRPFGAH
jgi:hypothetical protein